MNREKPRGMGVTTPDIVRERLNELHDTYGLSWRKIASLDDYSGISAGTLCAIAKGYPVPKKWHAHFGLRVMLPAPACLRCGGVHTTRRCTAIPVQHNSLFAMPAEVLRWKIENREEL